MRIGIDFDSTIAKIDAPWLGRLNAVFRTNYRPEDWTDWDLTFLTAEERRVLFDVLTPDLYEVVEPYPDAPEVIRDLARVPGVELVCVTANPTKNSQDFAAAKRRWLLRNVPELSSSVIFARSKSGLGLDVLVDDAPQHFERTDFIPVLVERPWNRTVPCRLRFREWSEGRRMLDSVIKKFQRRFNQEPRQLPAILGEAVS
jgi:5'(3')-deoxyribonucleotidase